MVPEGEGNAHPCVSRRAWSGGRLRLQLSETEADQSTLRGFTAFRYNYPETAFEQLGRGTVRGGSFSYCEEPTLNMVLGLGERRAQVPVLVCYLKAGICAVQSYKGTRMPCNCFCLGSGSYSITTTEAIKSAPCSTPGSDRKPG